MTEILIWAFLAWGVGTALLWAIVEAIRGVR